MHRTSLERCELTEALESKIEKQEGGKTGRFRTA
jgi:hypothetical protein